MVDRFVVKWNFDRCQSWTTDLKRLFGPTNEGRTVEADRAGAAVERFADENNLNPYYLKAEPAPRGM
jgi:hypothetical protein